MNRIGAGMLAVVAVSLAVGSAQGAPAKAKNKPKGPPQTMLIIWGGGPAKADADKAAAHFTSQGFVSSQPLTTLFSSEITGLKPGFHIAVLGACPGREATTLLTRARRFYGGVYLRRIPKAGAIAALKCPTVLTPKQSLYFEPAANGDPVVVEDDEEITTGKERLKVHVQVTLASNGEQMSASWSEDAQLFQGDKVIDSQNAMASSFAKVDSFESNSGAIVLVTTDTTSDCGSGSYLDATTTRRTFKILKGKIKVTEQEVSSQRGSCPPSPEGLGYCELNCKMARFEATQAACDNTPREKCEEALADYDAKAEPCDCSEQGGDPQGD